MRPLTSAEFSTLMASLSDKKLTFFRQGGEAALYKIEGTQYLLRLPKIFMPTDEQLDLMDVSNVVYSSLTELKANFVPHMVPMATRSKKELFAKHESLEWIPHVTDDIPGAAAELNADTIYNSIQIFEQVEGVSLKECLAAKNSDESSLPVYGCWQEVIELFVKIALSVNYLNELGIAHCDLGPDNVLVAGPRVVLIDFGRAQLMQEGNIRSTMTSCLYSPPECSTAAFDKQISGYAVDRWALGVLFYLLITGTDNVFTIKDFDPSRAEGRLKIRDSLQKHPAIDFSYQAFATPQGQLAKATIEMLLNFDAKRRATYDIIADPLLDLLYLKGFAETLQIDFAEILTEHASIKNLSQYQRMHYLELRVRGETQNQARIKVAPTWLNAWRNQHPAIKAFSLFLVLMGASLITVTSLLSLPVLSVLVFSVALKLGQLLGAGLILAASALTLSDLSSTLFAAQRDSSFVEAQRYSSQIQPQEASGAFDLG